MGILEFLVLLLVAGLCGAVAQAIAGFSRGGFLVAIAVGFIGALLGIVLPVVLFKVIPDVMRHLAVHPMNG